VPSSHLGGVAALAASLALFPIASTVALLAVAVLIILAVALWESLASPKPAAPAK
jgi:hypothetical protein